MVKNLGGSVSCQSQPSSDPRGLDTLLAACELRIGLQSLSSAAPGSKEVCGDTCWADICAGTYVQTRCVKLKVC